MPLTIEVFVFSIMGLVLATLLIIMIRIIISSSFKVKKRATLVFESYREQNSFVQEKNKMAYEILKQDFEGMKVFDLSEKRKKIKSITDRHIVDPTKFYHELIWIKECHQKKLSSTKNNDLNKELRKGYKEQIKFIKEFIALASEVFKIDFSICIDKNEKIPNRINITKNLIAKNYLNPLLSKGLTVDKLLNICLNNGLIDVDKEEKTRYKYIGHLIYFLKDNALYKFDNNASKTAESFKDALKLTCAVESIKNHMGECPDLFATSLKSYLADYTDNS